MSEKTLKLKIITPAKVLVDKEVQSVVSMTTEGEIGILPEHIPFMTTLDIGVTKFNLSDTSEYVATIGGLLQVSGDEVKILTEAAELGNDIDVPRATAAKERAEARLREKSSDVDTDRAQIALSRAIARIQAGSKTRHR